MNADLSVSLWSQVVNGGALSIEEGARATFEGTAEFRDNSVLNRDIGPIEVESGFLTARGISYVVKKGGAIHNKVHGRMKCDTALSCCVEYGPSEKLRFPRQIADHQQTSFGVVKVLGVVAGLFWQTR